MCEVVVSHPVFGESKEAAAVGLQLTVAMWQCGPGKQDRLSGKPES